MKNLSQQQYDELIKRGLNPDQINELAQKNGYSLPKKSSFIDNVNKVVDSFTTVPGTFIPKAKDIKTGFAKGAIRDVARPVSQALQTIGQGFIAGIDPTKTYSEVRSQTGFKSLKDETPQGQAVNEALVSKNVGETAGRIAVNIASFFIPTSPAVTVAGRTLQGVGRTVNRAAIGISSKEAPLIQAYKAVYPVPERIFAALKGGESVRPFTNAETAIKKMLFGTESMIGVQAKRAATNIWGKVISPALKRSKVEVDMPSFINEILGEVSKVKELSRQKDLLDALEAFADDYKSIKKVNMEDLQAFKEGWAKFLPEKTWKNKPIGSAFKEIQNIASSLARVKIYSALDDIAAKAAYFDYGNLKNLQELGQKSMTGAKLKGGAGSFINSVYHKIITPIATTAGVTLYKTGEGLEFVGKMGAKKLGDLFR